MGRPGAELEDSCAIRVRGEGSLLHVCSRRPGPGWLGLSQQRTANRVAPTTEMDGLAVLRSRCPQGWFFLETLPAAGVLSAVMTFRGARISACIFVRLLP